MLKIFMQWSVKKLFYLILGIAILSSFTLSGLSLYFNSKLAEKQDNLLYITNIYAGRYNMNSAITFFSAREQNILIAKNSEDIAKIAERAQIEQQFKTGVAKLAEVAITYPNVQDTLSSLKALYQIFLIADQQLFELTKSKIWAQTELSNKVQLVNTNLIEVRSKTDSINGQLTLTSIQNQRQVKEELTLPKLLDSISGRKQFKASVSQLFLSNTAHAQLISKNLNNVFSNLSELIAEIINQTNQDELNDLASNRLPQLLQLIRDELQRLKLAVKMVPELYNIVVEIEVQFETIASQISESPKQTIVKIWTDLIFTEVNIREKISKIQNVQQKIMEQFNFLDVIVINLKDELLANSSQIIFKNRIIVSAMVLIILLVLMTLGYYLVRMLTSSLNIITDTMKKIAKEEGNLNYRIEETPFEDLNELRVAFNTMTSKLSYIQSHLKDLVQMKISELSAANINLEKDLQQRTLMEEKVAILHQNLMQASRRAGMADVATSVLHNIGNILNSVIISLTLIQDGFKNTSLKKLGNVISMIGDHVGNLGYYLVEDEKGKLIPAYLIALQKSLTDERMNLEIEIKSLRTNVGHIENILVMQQSIGGKSVIAEPVHLPDIVEMALQICGFLTIENIEIEKKYSKCSTIVSDKSKLIQILVNLLLNARDALTLGNFEILNKTIAIEIDEVNKDVELVVRDNGSGVLYENLTKIFSFGFSTKKKGHGFGLQSAALSAKELGGNLRVVSEGLRQGTAFILTLPKAIVSNEPKDET